MRRMWTALKPGMSLKVATDGPFKSRTGENPPYGILEGEGETRSSIEPAGHPFPTRQFVFSGKNEELTLRQKAQKRRIATNLKPFVGNPAGNQSRPVELDQQPEASLAWWVGDPPCEA